MKIVIKNINKKFKNNVVLDDINMELESGKIYGLCGRNGSGKSVLLKIICGFYYPTSGEVLFDGINYSSNNTYPKDLRALIEKPSFLPNLSGFENLKLLASIQNKIGDKEILETLKKVNLFDEKDKPFKEYSLGMKQKLGIAQVLMEEPKIMILDEPFNGIEEQSVNKIKKVLEEEKEKDKLIIMSSHIKEDIEALADIKLYMDDGKLVEKKESNETE
jgi:ABC-2 type transport system ATP-binding protein